MIQVGDRLPDVEFTAMTADGQHKLTTEAVFKGRKVALFGVPGAFTPTCSMNHLPGYVKNADKLKAKGIDSIACVAVNDVHVMTAWGRQSGCDGKVLMLADGNGEFAEKTGLEADYSPYGMGRRSKRFAMIVDDGVVSSIEVEDKPGVSVSGAEAMLGRL